MNTSYVGELRLPEAKRVNPPVRAVVRPAG